MNLKRVVVWLALALVVLYVLQAPAQAARLVLDAGAGIALIAASLFSFIGSLV